VRAHEKAEKTLGAKFNIRAFHDAVLDRFITEGGKGLIRIWSDYVSVLRGQSDGLGSARASRAGFGASPKRTLNFR
jgi:hypothetical protein